METILKDNLTKVELIDSIQFESPRYNNDHFTKMIIDYKNYDLAKEENLTRKEIMCHLSSAKRTLRNKAKEVQFYA